MKTFRMKNVAQFWIFFLTMWHIHALAWKPELNEKPSELTNYEFVDGSPISLANLIGKTVVLYVGGDWCPPCAVTRPVVEKLTKQYENQGVVTIFVSADDNNLRAEKLKEQNTLGMKIALPKLDVCPVGKCAKGAKVLGDFGTTYVYPSAFVINPKGLVVSRMNMGAGIRDNLEAELKKAVLMK